MQLDEHPDRRGGERRIDKLAGQIRLKFLSLKRTIGLAAARGYLARNGYSPESIESMALSKERRKQRRRFTNGMPRAGRPAPVEQDASMATALVAEDIALLYKLRWETDAGVGGLRLCDCPPRFSQYGFVAEGPQGAPRITERGRAWLLLWTRAKALIDISQACGVAHYSDDVQAWLEANRFVSASDQGLKITARGQAWLEINMPALTAPAPRKS
jgi:hypothetical protein